MSESSHAALVDRLVSGNRSAPREMASQIAAANDGESRAALLDPLAVTASTSGHALEALVAAIDQESLAIPAIRSLLFDPDEIDDVAQEALIAVSQSIGTYRGDARFTTWLGSIARNTTITHLRRKRDRSSGDGVEDMSSTERLSSLIANRNVLRDAIDRLDERYRLPLVLRDVEHLAYQDIADRLGQPLGTTKSLIFRARALLASSLDLSTQEGRSADG